MKFNELPFLSQEVLQAQVVGASLDTSYWTPGEVVVRAKDGALLLRRDDVVLSLKTTARSGALMFHAENLTALWWLAASKPQQVSLRFLLPQQTVPNWPAQIAVDTRAADALQQSGRIARADVAAAVAWLQDEFLLSSLDAGTWRTLVAIHERQDEQRVQLLGRKHTLDLKRDEAGVLWVERVAPRKHIPDQPFVLVEGPIGFADAALGISPQEREHASRLQADAGGFGSYLELWKLYGTKEWQQALKQAAEIGAFNYTGYSDLSDEGGGWCLQGDDEAARRFWNSWKDQTSGDDQAEVGDEAPDWRSEQYQDPTAPTSRNPLRGQLNWRNGSFVLETNSNTKPPAQGYVYLSLAGNRTQHKRRISARRAIEAGMGVAALGPLLQDLPTPSQRPSNLKALTPYARDCFHQGRPTERQEDALRVALNTPDVALIIGPPGTGKTQVIAALQRRLSEDSQGQVIAQQVLISSYQHDAVENALERTEVYGLPAIKVGGSKRREGGDPVASWCSRKHKEVALQLKTEQAKDPSHALLQDLDELLATLLVIGALPEVRAEKFNRMERLLKGLAQQARVRIPSGWWDKWEDARLASETTTAPLGSLGEQQRLRCRRLVRALRVLSESFADDGIQRAMAVQAGLSQHGGLLTQEDEAVLHQAFTLQTAPSEGLLQELALFQRRLLDRLRRSERSTEQRSRLPDPLSALLLELRTTLNDKLSAIRLGRAAVLNRYVSALEDQSRRVRSAVERYSSVVGATCQQAASRQMALLKDGSEDVLSGLRFDSVVIDEAARANPLDLFVPMALAKRRIVLVGDPRQLPHLLDSDIEEEIRAERGEQVDSTVYQQSLFERLWRQFEKRRATDGFSRVVMLDTQFRMHPRLGDFVSAQFYERAGLGKVKSGRPASDFVPTMPGFGAAVCAWIDVPLTLGKEEGGTKNNPSRWRTVEARRIAQEVQRLLSELPAEMSLGVITFYAAQRDAIFEALAKHAITERSEEGWRVHPEFAVSPTGGERLRIGTVDAFQGKEFDVVLLSAVRSNTLPVTLPRDPDQPEPFERQASGRYGHLRSANRLNVAMSRQRRLLVGVGDEQMFRGDVAQEAVPEMHAFLLLCEEEALRG